MISNDFGAPPIALCIGGYRHERGTIKITILYDDRDEVFVHGEEETCRFNPQPFGPNKSSRPLSLSQSIQYILYKT
jgi:hypothetical protein